MDIQFENRNNYIPDLKRSTMGAATNMYFEERHFFLIKNDVQVSALKEEAAQRKALRASIDKDVTQNSLLCMTEGQPQSLFATIKEMRPIKLGYAGAPNATPITA